MMRALLIIFGLVLLGAAMPQLATMLFIVVILLGIVWLTVLRAKWSIMRSYRGGRR